jgi:queuine tRNA-ribosyltransferase
MATRCCSFEVRAELGGARTGALRLPHGDVPTPAFMPVGTRATVRGLTADQVRATGASMVLANTYHLWIRPGPEVLGRLGGLHRVMDWRGPILTDSGGFQVFSLKKHVKVDEAGATFRSPIDGLVRSLTPEVATALQEGFGVDVAMAFDECIEFPATRERVVHSTARTTRWLRRCLAARRHADRTALFGIVQGGTFADLRAEHARELAAMDLDGYAIGGLSVGEDAGARADMTAAAAAELPRDRARYLMGVGQPVDLLRAIAVGVDLFDCVLPTRAGRHAQAYTSVGKVNLRNARFIDADRPLDPSCGCPVCVNHPMGYLSHLVRADEMLGATLITMHNLTYYQSLMARARAAIAGGDAAAMATLEAEAAVASGSGP